MIKILNKNGEVLLEVDAGTLSYANLSGADLSYADLSGADLSYADLRHADLSYADLSGADLSYADLRHADLRHADLSYADLRYADLRHANLSGADLRHTDLIIITWSYWITYITKGHIRIGCHSRTLSEWRGFSDDEIASMDSRALDFWKQNKELIISLCERFENK